MEFIKSYRDNPKINAVVMIKGTLGDWPKLPPLPVEPEEDELADDLKVKNRPESKIVVKIIFSLLYELAHF